MAIDFTQGAKPGNSGTGSKADMPKSKFWLNIGYTVANANLGKEGFEDKPDAFISLPYGLPLDSMENLKISGKNADFRDMQSARNTLLEDLKAHAATLQPGEEMVINLQVQLRHVNEEVSDTPASENRYVRRLEVTQV